MGLLEAGGVRNRSGCFGFVSAIALNVSQRGGVGFPPPNSRRGPPRGRGMAPQLTTVANAPVASPPVLAPAASGAAMTMTAKIGGCSPQSSLSSVARAHLPLLRQQISHGIPRGRELRTVQVAQCRQEARLGIDAPAPHAVDERVQDQRVFRGVVGEVNEPARVLPAKPHLRLPPVPCDLRRSPDATESFA